MESMEATEDTSMEATDATSSMEATEDTSMEDDDVDKGAAKEDGSPSVKKEDVDTSAENGAAGRDVSAFEFVVPLYQAPGDKQRLPTKFAEWLAGQEPRVLQLREASGGTRSWEADVLFDGANDMYLSTGWKAFADDHGLEAGHMLAFAYDGKVVLTVKIYDRSLYRRHYHVNNAVVEEDEAVLPKAAPAAKPVLIVIRDDD